MKSLAVIAFASVFVLAAGAAHAQEDIARKRGCTNCHAVNSAKVGPSFKEIAAKYKGKADAAETLAGELKAGKSHPAVKASEDDIKTLVTWILAM